MVRVSQESIDASAAWSQFDPSVDGAWDKQRVRHLVRRSAIGASDQLIDELLGMNPEAAVDRLLTGAPDADDRQQQSDQLARTILASNDPKRLSAWWTYELTSSPHPLRERMTVFWHGHFATSGDKVLDAEALYRQNRMFRDQALGNFRTLTHGVAKDPAMLVYLDSATNRKAHPNENFARELMELFCLGEGNYTEADVQQLARCFTGWEVRQGRFRFNRYQHDSDEKTIFGKTSEFPDAESVDWVVDHPSASFFIAGKLYRLFVADEPTPSRELLEPLANKLVAENWEIAPVVRTILASKHFLSEENYGRKVRSPVDLLIGLLRTLEGSTNSTLLADELLKMGMGLFFPPNVKGWDGGRTWISSATLLARANGVGRTLRNEATRFALKDPKDYFAAISSDVVELLDHLQDRLLVTPLPVPLRDRLVSSAREIRDERERGLQLLHALLAQPLAQLA